MLRVNKRRLRLPQINQISDLVRAQMNEQDVSVRQLAEKAGVSETHFNKILSGSRPWTLHILLEVARAMLLKLPGFEEGALEALPAQVDDMRLTDPQLPRFADFLHKLQRIQTTEQTLALSQVLEALALLEAHRAAEKETTEVLVVNTSEPHGRRRSSRTRRSGLEHVLSS